MKSASLVSVPVTDPQKSKAFYLKMGLHLVREMPMDKEKVWMQMGFPEGGPGITLVTWFPKMPPGSLQAVVIDCENIVGEIDRLKTNGITTGKIDDTPWGKFATITDPDGEYLEPARKHTLRIKRTIKLKTVTQRTGQGLEKRLVAFEKAFLPEGGIAYRMYKGVIPVRTDSCLRATKARQ